MKKHIPIVSISLFCLFFQNCTSQSKVSNDNIVELVNSEEFTFHAERANPTNYDVINVMNSLPNSPSTRMLQLNGENYTIEIKKNQLDVVLPYFGRVYNPSYGNTNGNSYRFISKDFTITKTQSKKGNSVFTIKPKDANNVTDIYIEVYKNGKAFTSVKSNDRQPITYDGYITKN
ncbi:DUF4251 domain-containing protein [Chryseobacterium sp.]|uniref:DUF4251 domain-containing protein n=1 Tax=Chryseobacterium sp. TaxID=1871047 RepID=UPI00388FB82C